jgi:hypothetical protein
MQSPLKMLFKSARGLLFVALLLVTSQSSNAQADEQVHRVLFVGNSYTYVNSLPQLFKALYEHAMPGHRVEVKFVGGGGATLEKHWEVEEAQAEIRSGRWDFVVLQGQSMLGSSDLTAPGGADIFFEYARRFNGEIVESGARTVFYMTWSRENRKQDQQYLSDAYTKIGSELGSIVAPVGMVWDQLRDNPAVDLYQGDGSHPEIAGSYLAATTLLAAIFDIQPSEAPGELYGHEILRGGALSPDERRLSDLSAAQVGLVLSAVSQVFVTN